MDCKLVRSHLDAYVDGELEPTPVIEFERHLDDCGSCRNELALSRLMQRGVREIAQPAAPQTLKLRLTRALDEAEAQQRARPDAAAQSLGILAADRGGLAGGLRRRHDPQRQHGTTATRPKPAIATRRARRNRAAPRRPTADRHQRRAPDKVTSWFRGKVDFRMRPVEFSEPQVHFLGARVSHVQGSQRGQSVLQRGVESANDRGVPAAAVVPAAFCTTIGCCRAGARIVNAWAAAS